MWVWAKNSAIWLAWPKVTLVTVSGELAVQWGPVTHTLSDTSVPEHEPVPYWMLKVSPLGDEVDDCD